VSAEPLENGDDRHALGHLEVGGSSPPLGKSPFSLEKKKYLEKKKLFLPSPQKKLCLAPAGAKVLLCKEKILGKKEAIFAKKKAVYGKEKSI
jgi:hypothetical protein